MNLDTKNLPPEVAAYIRSLEQKNQQLEKQLVKLQSLNEQLVKMRTPHTAALPRTTAAMAPPASPSGAAPISTMSLGSRLHSGQLKTS